MEMPRVLSVSVTSPEGLLLASGTTSYSVDRSVLEAVFNKAATNGKIAEDNLTQALRDASVPCTDKRMASEALQAVHQAAGREHPWLDLEEFIEVAQMLSASSTVGVLVERCLETPSSTTPAAMRWSELFTGLCRRSQNEELYSTMKPTTKLVLVMAVMTLVMCVAVAGTAIGLNVDSAIRNQQDGMQRELELVQNAVESFTVTQARQQ
eukprot:RCo029292